jgi:hypothetical protein
VLLFLPILRLSGFILRLDCKSANAPGIPELELYPLPAALLARFPISAPVASFACGRYCSDGEDFRA